MKNRSNSRGYLSQIAQPLLPRQPVLKVRHDALRAETQRPVVPVIEDRFEFAKDRQAQRSVPPSAREATTVTPPLLSAPASLPPSPETPHAPPAVIFARLTSPSGVSPEEPEAQEVAGIYRSAARPRNREEVRRDPPVKEKEKVTETPDPLVRQTLEIPEALTPPAGNRKLSDEPPSLMKTAAPILVSTKSSAHVPNDAGAGRAEHPAELLSPDSGSEEPRPPNRKDTPAMSRAPEKRRVHIGTVEIRAVLPQPAIPVAQPAAVVVRPATEAMPRGRSGSEHSFGPGLAWTYGLVQG
jgi:hypothetical protein